MGDIVYREKGDDDSDSLESRVEKLPKISIDTFDELCDPGQYNLMYHLPDLMVKKKRFRALIVSDSSP